MQAPPAATIIAGRYAIEATLGRGGTGTVYRVLDTREGTRVALKRVPSTGPRASRHRALLEREYHTLTQLAHPHIIEVFDYGLDEQGPYYTMELLEGDDLRAHGRIPWREAALLLCDVASSLAILHSRGLIHRDLSVRNVRCTAEGRAKLLDFGAMMPMGLSRDVVGTPPFVAPEALQMQALDARTDLYALGALGYYMLTGRNAFPARKLAELRDVWRSDPAPPRKLIADVPEALSELVMRLLSRDRSGRPETAAEVMLRLSAIAELPRTEHVALSRSYLSTPTLVGRERALITLRRRALGLTRLEGATLLIEGASGSGRSRLLDACVLEAKLLGAIVVRADASDAAGGPLGVLRALGSQLVAVDPERARRAARLHLDVLGPVIEGLLPVAPEGTPPGLTPSAQGNAAPDRARLLRELRELVIELARGQRILIAVDDVDRIDEPSQAFLAALAHKVAKHSIVIAIAAERSLDQGALTPLKMLRDRATVLAAEPLLPAETELLLGSVFGQVRNLSLVAGRIHALAGGYPRATMELAQHLVDCGLARYDEGGWSLPESLNDDDLPHGHSASLTARVASLGRDALALAETLAVGEDDGLVLDRYAQASGLADHKQLFRVLDELVAARVLVAEGERYRFAQRGYPTVLREHAEPGALLAAHVRLASLLKDRLEDRPAHESSVPIALRRAHHLLRSGQEQQAVELLTSLDMIGIAAPLSLLEEALTAVERLGLPGRHAQRLRSAILGIAPLKLAVETFRRHLGPTFVELDRESGLLDYRELSDSLPALERLTQALTRAQARHDATPPEQRGYAPVDAIRELSRFCANCCSVALQTYDLEFLEQLPSLEPLEPLSPALGFVRELVHACRETLAGRTLRARAIHLRLLGRLDDTGHGFDPVYQKGGKLALHYLVGLLEASMGMASALAHAEVCESDPEHRVNAWRVRMALYLNHGNTEQARRCQRHAELLLLQESQPARYLGTSVAFELIAHVVMSDLLGVRRATEAVSELASRFAGWRPAEALGKASVRALQGDREGALELLEPGLALWRPGRHAHYPHLAAARIDWLSELGRHERALEVGRAELQACKEAEIDALDRWVQKAYALALARAGQPEQAVRLLEDTIAASEEVGIGGLSLGALYEARARVAMWMQDHVSFERYLERCAGEYKKGQNAALGAKLARLLEEARSIDVLMAEAPPETSALLEDGQAATEHQTVQSLLLECIDKHDRARCALALLLHGSTSQVAHLFGVQAGKLEHLASLPAAPCDPALLAFAEASLAAELESGEITETKDGPASTHTVGDRYQDARDRIFEAVFLEAQEQGQSRVAAVVAMHVPSGLRAVPPKELLTQIAEQLLEQGDVTGLAIAP